MKTIDLDGIWQGSGRIKNDKKIRFKASVPGCVHTDLQANDIIGDFYWRNEAENVQWIEDVPWHYEREFEANETSTDAYIEFDGLDTYCDVYLNGMHLGSCDNMFIAYRFNIGSVLRLGRNKIEVLFYSPIAMTNGRLKRQGAFTSERIYTRRMQCTYGWDWTHRFITCGIYRPVRICFPETTELVSSYIYTKSIDDYSAQLALELQFELKQPSFYVEITLISPLKERVFYKKRLIAESHMQEVIDIANPELWWPNGYGDPKLYQVLIDITENGVVKSHTEFNYGIKTVKVLQLPDNPGTPYFDQCRALKAAPHAKQWDHNETFSGFMVIINGVPIMCKGANWVPCEPFPSAESEEKITALLELAKDGHVNMIRVWGGGALEKDVFYQECDRLGILVTQDFMMACGNYPEDEGWFLKHLSMEAKHFALKLRNHTCLIWWSGDNENAIAGNENEADYPGRKAALHAIGPVLRQYDPQRYFMPSSPCGGVPFGSFTKGTTHNTQFLRTILTYIKERSMTDYQDFWQNFLSRFMAEEPIMGAPSVVSLRKFMTDDDIFGRDETMWRYHTKNNPSLKPLELFDYLKIYAEKLFGKFENGLDKVFKLQYAQYEWVRITMEQVRRNKWFSSGLLFWMYNDCWPASGWSIIDYYVLPKAAYYSFKRAAKGLIGTIEKKDKDYIVHACSDIPKPIRVTARLFVQKLDCCESIVIQEKEVEIGDNSTQPIITVNAAKVDKYISSDSILVCALSSQYGSDRAFYLPQRPQDMRLSSAKVRLLSKTENTVTIQSDYYVHAVGLEGEYVFEDNYFSLLPGEIRTISMKPSYGSKSNNVTVGWLGKC